MFVLAISRPCSNMGHVGLTSRSPGRILENLVRMKGKQTRSNLRQLYIIMFTSKALAFRLIPPRCRLLYIKRWKRELLKIFCLRWAFHGSLGPLVLIIFIKQVIVIAWLKNFKHTAKSWSSLIFVQCNCECYASVDTFNFKQTYPWLTDSIQDAVCRGKTPCISWAFCDTG